MKRKFEQTEDDEFYSNTALTQAIDDYNLILDETNSLKTYQIPETEDGINYQIAEDNRALFDFLENQRLSSLEIIRDLLNKGHNPNAPKFLISYPMDNGRYTKETWYEFPLALAKDKDLTSLLLRFGANPNQFQYGNELYCSALSLSFQNQDHFKMYVLAAYTKIEQNNINTIAKKMIMENTNGQFINKSVYESLVDEEYKIKVRDLLISQMDSNEMILDLIQKEANSNAMELDQKNSLIHLLKRRYAQSFSLSTWITLFAGFQQENNLLAGVPLDVLKLIMSYAHFSNHAEPINKIYDRHLIKKKIEQDKVTEEINSRHQVELQTHQEKLKAFRIIYTLLLENGSTLIRAKPLDSFDVNSLIKLKNLSRTADPLIANAWKLMIEHYDNIHDSNQPLINELIQWAADNDYQYQLQNCTMYQLSLFSSRKLNYDAYLEEKVKNRFNELLMGTDSAAPTETMDTDTTIATFLF